MPSDPNIERLIEEAEGTLDRYHRDYHGLSWREKVLVLVELTYSVKQLGIHSNTQAVRVGSRERIRLYLTQHVGVIISAMELEVVSGISEYGRRARELRVQDGYKILTGHSNDPETGIELGPSEYLLLQPEADLTAARRWSIGNRIRRETKGGAPSRLLRYLQENVGQVVTTEELRYVAKIAEFGRRVRELRTEQGYAIATCFTGRPDLSMGEYVLESLDRVSEPHDRQIPFAIQKELYERAGNACQLCGWSRERWTRENPRILELHHLLHHATGGANTLENLVVLCSKCHDDVHAGRVELPPDILA